MFLFYSKIITALLGFILIILGAFKIPGLGLDEKKKRIIVVIIGLLMLGISFWIATYEENEKTKSVKTIQGLELENFELKLENFKISQEMQKNRLMIYDLTESYIEKLGNNPYVIQLYNTGQNEEIKGNFKGAIKTYEKMLEFKPLPDIIRISMYILIGNCYYDLGNTIKAQQYFDEAVGLLPKLGNVQDAIDASTMFVFNLGCNLMKIGLLEEAQEFFDFCIENSDHLRDKLLKANILLKFSELLLNLNKKNEAIDKMLQAIQVFQEALKECTLENLTERYARNQVGLYSAYLEISKFQNATVNYKNAINAGKEALKVYTFDDFPIEYAKVQSKIGYAYCHLAKIENQTENYQKVFHTYQEALKVYTLEDFPEDYAMVQYNIGNVRSFLAEIENPAENYQKVFHAYQEALKVYTLEDFPEDYADIQRRLGHIYLKSVEIDSWIENFEKSIHAYQEALKVYTLEDFPEEYAEIQRFLGLVYDNIPEIEHHIENFEKSIHAYQEALKVYALEEYPYLYATTQEYMGITYNNFAEIENPIENYEKAIHAYKEAHKIYTKVDFPEPYAKIQTKSGVAYSKIYSKNHNFENYEKAIHAFQEALKFFTLEDFPEEYAKTYMDLGITYNWYYVISYDSKEANVEVCKKAIHASQEALKFFSVEKFPVEYAMLQSSLEFSYLQLAEIEDKDEYFKKSTQAHQEVLKIFPEDILSTIGKEIKILHNKSRN